MNRKKQVVIGLLGSVLDSGFHQERWNKWRPTISLCKHADLPVDRFELIFDPKFQDLANLVMAAPRSCAASRSGWWTARWKAARLSSSAASAATTLVWATPRSHLACSGYAARTRSPRVLPPTSGTSD